MAAVIKYRIEGEATFDPSNLGEVAEIQRELENVLDGISSSGMLGGYGPVLTAKIHNKRGGGDEA